MSSRTSSLSTASAEALRNWRYLLGVGIVFSLLGAVAILAPFVTGIGLSYLLGGVVLAGGVAALVQALRVRTWRATIWQGLLAVVYVVAGVMLLANPLVGLVALTLLLVAYIAVSGVVEIAMGLRLRPAARWSWFVASGALSLALAALLWIGFPSTAAWAVGLLVGVHFLTTGVALIAAGYETRRTAGVESAPTADTEPRSG
ncbi:HdeD family acid-resistance protein [Halobaculum lipolyticum]|uniref:HdeD family acid-resistance protein n=1 Tax=Halobaculum lipolyticum TaxID=3032001 RepID=A0ABD5WDQ1_9EURY|nr:DUF308 domain-containing protein [Halobaculum sp. DT31]